jgi:spore germination protein GerM
MNKKLIIWLLIIGGVIALVLGTKWIDRFFEIDSCLDRGGRWNYELNECEEYYQINNDSLSDFYWKSDYDTINNKEFLIKGRLIDSLGKSPNKLIEVLNKRNVQPKIEYLDIQSDTIKIQIVNDEFLTEQMGTTGAYCYLGETVFTLTENDLIIFVKIEMDFGSHASPGIYTRMDFKDLIK